MDRLQILASQEDLSLFLGDFLEGIRVSILTESLSQQHVLSNGFKMLCPFIVWH